MTEWWTYGLSDFLMFSPQAYWRLVARYNGAWWPAQVAGALAAAALPLLVRRQSSAGERFALLLLAAGWVWVGWAFYLRRYSEIFLAAPWLAGVCALQALLLLAAAAAPWRGHAQGSGGPRIGQALLGVALLYPLLAPATGHAWSEAEVFGFMPDPTALATVGVLLALRQPGRAVRVLLAIVPALSLLLGAATRWLIA